MSLLRADAAGGKALLLAGLWVVTIVGLVLWEPRFLQLASVTTILQFSTVLALVALGQAMVVMAGGAGIDLSVGGMVSLASVLSALALSHGLPPAALPLACVVLGAGLGAVNGVLVTRFRVLPLIATLGTFYVYAGLAVAITGGAAVRGVPDWITPLGRGAVGGVPNHTLMVMLPAYAAAGLVLLVASWGRWIYAMGRNEAAARLVGIPVDRTRFLLYVASGALAGLAALVANAWFGSARPNIGQNLELESLAAILLGGVSIFGGSGGVLGVAAAVLLIVTLKTGLQFVNVNAVWQVGIVGALLLFAVLIERPFARWRS